MNRHDSHTQGGFTLLEVMIVAIAILPILTGIVMTTTSVNGTLTANTKAADVSSHSRRIMTRLGRLVRPAQMSSIRMVATAVDVKAGLAQKAGTWIEPTDKVWRPGIEFTAASGLLSMNAALTTSPRRAVFEMDAGEQDNGQDDDGDGLIDEGKVVLLENGISTDILRDVEDVSFQIDGRLIKLRLTTARRDSKGRVHRFASESEFYIRNN